MHGVMHFSSPAATPDRRTVLSAQGIPDDATVPDRVAALVEEAFEIYSRLVEPAGIQAEISTEEFAAIYRGEGGNAPRTPLAGIFPDARRLALFAVTIGQPVCLEISRLFSDRDPALGYALDTIASAGADSLAEVMARRFETDLAPSSEIAHRVRVLPYSPGYCGWHVSGQGKLFAALRPERVGISLNASYLMQPLKSVSGVLVAADPEVHEFDIDFPFCADCADQACRQRIQSVLFDIGGQ